MFWQNTATATYCMNKRFINMVFQFFTYSNTPRYEHFIKFLTISRRFDIIWNNIQLFWQEFWNKFALFIFILMLPFVKIVTGDVRVTRSICRSKNFHFGFFKESKPNFGYIHLKTPNSFLECQNKNIQISEFNQFRKICQNNWILVEINWNLLKIVSYYIIQLCWRVWLIFKTKNQVTDYILDLWSIKKNQTMWIILIMTPDRYE